ncbi:MAG: YHS domain-containing (seleno)protein [Bacteroidota bacterium]
MRTFAIITLLFLSIPALSQDHVNLKSGYAAQGYDVVSYFQHKPVKGDKKFTTTHEGVKYKFQNEANLKTFMASPDRYLPEYGGFCAYAIAKDGKKVSVNPKTFTITDGKLYLFYNSWGVNTLEKWQEEGAEDLTQKADTQWKVIVNSQ